LNGVDIYYDVSGLDDKIPIFFTGHGRKSWMWQITCFSEYYKVVTHDRRGTGFSDDPPGDWTVKDYVEDVRALMDHLGIEKAIVGGHSLGGAISCLFGLDYPERVLGLIFSGQVYYWNRFVNEWSDQRSRGTRGSYQPRSFDWEEHGPPTANPEFTSSKLGSYFMKVMREAGSWRTPEQREKNGIRMSKSLRGWDMRPRAEELKALGESVPVLIMFGGFESQVGIPLAYEWHKADAIMLVQEKTPSYGMNERWAF
jgi:pimeloyl-ACP methyl ester carboxylesterase